MTIKKLTEYKGASRFGICAECGELESDAHRLYRLQLRDFSICLCPDCFRKTRVKMNDVNLDGYIGKVEPQEKQCANCNHYGKLSLDCGRCDDDCSMFEPQESEEV